MTTYSVRREVFNMPLKMWDKLQGGDYHGTAKNFLDTIGLPGGKTALFNDEERKFFDELYAIHRGG